MTGWQALEAALVGGVKIGGGLARSHGDTRTGRAALKLWCLCLTKALGRRLC